MRLREALAFAFFSVLCLPASATHPCATGVPLTDRLAEASVDALVLTTDPRRLSLAGITVPDHRGAVLPVPGAAVSAHAISDKPDRWRRHAAQVFADGRWLQGELLKRGIAILEGDGPLDTCRLAMQEAENAARQEKRGLWAGDLPLPTTDPAKVTAKKGRFSVLMGKVVSIGDRETRLYLNFGKKWSQDVTAVANRKGRGAFKGSFSRLKGLAGRTVLLRGVIEESGGPLIRIVHDGQIVALD